MLTPYLVSMVALVGLLRHVGNLATTHLVALCLTVSGIAYAYVIGANERRTLGALNRYQIEQHLLKTMPPMDELFIVRE